MAGTWIKMLTTLHDSHKVRRLSRLVGCDRFGVVGRLHRIWSWADEHTIDGRFTGDIKDIDDIAEFDGFARAMIEIGWLAQIGDEITLIDFEKHNGETAKKRAQGAKSASRRRGNARVAQKSRTERDASVTKSAPREEKRREEKSSAAQNPPKPPKGGGRSAKYTPEFDAWWKIYPCRDGCPPGNKREAFAAWLKLDRAAQLQVGQATKALSAAVASESTKPKDAERFLRPPRRGGDPPYLAWLDVPESRAKVHRNDQKTLIDHDELRAKLKDSA